MAGPDKTELIDCITGMGRYLCNKQVVAEDIILTLEDGSEQEVSYSFIREKPGPFLFSVKRNGDNIVVKASGTESDEEKVEPGGFFRLYPGKGIRKPAKGEGGITFLYKAPANDNVNEICLQAYDRGGIWDDGVNMEAFRYESQVAGTYYADAYSAFTFAWMAANGYGDEFIEAASMALDFIRRIYPRYEPTYLDGMPHCDFKNPAYIETVEEYMTGLSPAEDLERWRSLYPEMIINEEYSPTNVYALRYHWWSAYNYYMKELYPDKAPRFNPKELLPRMHEDQTPDGLIMDNNYSEISFGGYSDAHDLTYHLYALSWLARGLDYLPLDEVTEMFLRGATFSLSLTSPGGEASYLGRSANNIYHLISGIYVFLRAARKHLHLAPRFYRAARLIFDYLKGYKHPEGNYPVGLNDYPEELMGWSHCQTPYNGTNAYFLIRCLPLLPGESDETAEIEEENLELEEDALILYPRSRHGAFSNNKLYAVIFAGSDISPYPHSGVHNTGVAGLALLGHQGHPSLLPVLEQSLREEEWSTSDLPDIVEDEDDIIVPLDRGSLELSETDGVKSIVLTVEYANFRVRQEYIAENETLRLHTTLKCLESGDYRLVGAPGFSVQVGEKHSHTQREDGFLYSGPAGGFEFRMIESDLPPGSWEIMDTSSTGRGWHQKIAWCVEGSFNEGEEYRYSASFTLRQ